MSLMKTTIRLQNVLVFCKRVLFLSTPSAPRKHGEKTFISWLLQKQTSIHWRLCPGAPTRPRPRPAPWRLELNRQNGYKIPHKWKNAFKIYGAGHPGHGTHKQRGRGGIIFCLTDSANCPNVTWSNLRPHHNPLYCLHLLAVYYSTLVLSSL